jgi:hypothetical protein
VRRLALTIPVRVFREIRFKDRLQKQFHSLLYHPVLDRRYAQWSKLARPSLFRDQHAPYRLRFIPPRLQFLRQLGQIPLYAIRLDVLEGLSIHAWRSTVLPALRIGRFQKVLPIHLVVQQVETVFRFRLGLAVEFLPQFLDLGPLCEADHLSQSPSWSMPHRVQNRFDWGSFAPRPLRRFFARMSPSAARDPRPRAENIGRAVPRFTPLSLCPCRDLYPAESCVLVAVPFTYGPTI